MEIKNLLKFKKCLTKSEAMPTWPEFLKKTHQSAQLIIAYIQSNSLELEQQETISYLKIALQFNMIQLSLKDQHLVLLKVILDSILGIIHCLLRKELNT